MNQKIKFPRSEKVYLPGTLFPELRVAMRKVEQVPSTNFVDGEKVLTPNPEVPFSAPMSFGLFADSHPFYLLSIRKIHIEAYG